MKFLCVECDEAMKLQETRGPDEGSMTVIFGCPKCSREVAMLTNAMETQMVRSLGVKIGGKPVAHEPMENVRASLSNGVENGSGHPTTPSHHDEHKPSESASGSKCPFTGMVTEAFEKPQSEVNWTEQAEERMARIPDFVRPMVKKSIEQFAKEIGRKEIDLEMLESVKGKYGL